MREIALVCVLLLVSSAAGAFSHDEGVNGELSGDRLAPTPLVAALGSNSLSGSVIAGDLDYVRVSLPGGLQLASLYLTAISSADDLAFIAVQAGTIFTVTPASATPSSLLGYTHFGSGLAAGNATVGNDILDDMGVAPLAMGFVPPLTGSDYTFWIQQTAAQAFGYSFNFVVVPEPSTIGLLVMGLGAIAVRRRP